MSTETSAARIREYIHSGVVATANGDEVARARHDEVINDALGQRLNAAPDSDAGRSLLDALEL